MESRNLSVCIFVRNEGRYFSEWIAFHRLLGVEHFYVYLNAAVGEDHLTEAIVVEESYIGEDVTLVRWPGTSQQCKAYQHCLETYGHETMWLAFLDTDEFLWSWEEAKREDSREILPAAIDDCLFVAADPLKVGAIAVHWALFGSSGELEYRPELVIDRFTCRAEAPDRHVKTICRPAVTLSIGPNPHTVILRPGYSVINETGRVYPPNYANTQEGPAYVLCINHYHTKSREEYESRKLTNPDANSGRIPTAVEVLNSFAAHDRNEVEDTRVKDLYGDKVRTILQAFED